MSRSQLLPLEPNLLTALLSTTQAVRVPDLHDIYSKSWMNPGPRPWNELAEHVSVWHREGFAILGSLAGQSGPEIH